MALSTLPARVDGKIRMAHCGAMRHYHEQTETMTATRRLQALSRRHASGSSARHDAAGRPSAKRVPQQSMASHDISVVSSSPPPPPPSDAARHSTFRKVSIGQLSGVREHDADITVERRVCKTMPRMILTPGHALAAILLLVAVTCASLTLLVRQSLNYAAASRPQERQTIQTYESQEAEASAGGRTNRSQAQHDSDQEKSGQSQSDSTSASQAERFSTQSDGGLVNLNTATLEELDSISGIGPVTARKILDYRQRIGMFSSVDQLLEVSGIGVKTLEKMRAKVTV